MRNRSLSRKYMRNAASKVVLLFVAAVLTVFIFFCFFMNIRTKVQAVGLDKEIVYESYEIQKGDTLSSIAQRYASGVNMSKGDYMYTVRKTNQISGDLIHAGCYLVIPVEKTI